MLRALLKDFSRMPDAGFIEDDPRWQWWHETAVTRDAARRLLEEDR